jgi:hypothetical protein
VATVPRRATVQRRAARDTRRGVTRHPAPTSILRLLLPACALAAVVATASPARADATGWASISGGAAIKQGDVVLDEGSVPSGDDGGQVAPQLQFDAGVGTTPSAPFIVGGLFRISPTLGQRTDFAVMARVATHGFQTGPFGLALEAGGYARADDEASVGFVGGAVLGGPLGVQLTVLASVGTTDEYGGAALLGLDLLRLTIYREDLLDYWPNPLPPERDVAGR